MPTSDREVFEQLISDTETETEIDYLTYAIFAYRKSHWINRFRIRNGKEPSPSEIDEWIAGLSDYEFARMRTDAAKFFAEAARTHMASELAEARKKGSEEAIVAHVNSIFLQIKAMSRPRNQLLLALGTAVLVPIVLGASIFCIRQFELYMPSISSFTGKELRTSAPAPPSPPGPAAKSHG